MLPAIVHLKSIKQNSNEMRGPFVLLLTPNSRTKEDIFTATKAYIDAAEVKCFCLYDADEKLDQIEKLKSRILFEIFFFLLY